MEVPQASFIFAKHIYYIERELVEKKVISFVRCLKDIKLGKISQEQKGKCCMILVM